MPPFTQHGAGNYCCDTTPSLDVDFHNFLSHFSTLLCPSYVLFSGNGRGFRQSTRAGQMEIKNLGPIAAEINNQRLACTQSS